MPVTPLAEGDLVTPSIRLARKLGSGGMGSVWIAEHLTLHTEVVVKFLAHALVHDEPSRARFSREAAAASQVKSPHVVQTHDHGVTADGQPFIVMELLEGEDLGRRLNRERRLPPRDVALIVSQVCKALSRAHDRGVVHRDVKPDNIFLCDVGEGDIFVKVLDFGIAKRATEEPTGATVTGQAIGTPSFMSPEQLVGAKEVDHRADLWSLGVVTYRALTGERPFAGGTIGAAAISIHTQPHPIPSHKNPELPAAFDAWFEKACAKDVDARFQSARELADALNEALGVVPTNPKADRTGEIPISVSALPVSPELETAQAPAARSIPPHVQAGAEARRSRRGFFVAVPIALVLAAAVTVATRRTPVAEPTKAASAAGSVAEPAANPTALHAAAPAPAPSSSTATEPSSIPSAQPASTGPKDTKAPAPIAKPKPVPAVTAKPSTPAKPVGGYDDIE